MELQRAAGGVATVKQRRIQVKLQVELHAGGAAVGNSGLQVGVELGQRWGSSELQVELQVKQRWSSSELQVELRLGLQVDLQVEQR